jgi:O-antigen/teichoic acid export membrane protein
MEIAGHIRNLTKHSAIYTLSTTIQRAQGLVMLPILTDTTYIASKSEYGDYTLVYMFIAFMNVFYLYGLDAAFLRYYFLGKQKKEDIYRTAFQFLTLSAILSSTLVMLFSNQLALLIFKDYNYAIFVKMAAGILFLDTMCSLPYLILRAEERSVLFTLIRIGRFIFELILNIVFVVFFKLGVKGILVANICAAFLNLLILLPIQYSYLKGKYSKQAIQDLLRFGLPMLPNGLAFLVVEISDRFLMLNLLDKETLGEYGANFKFGTIMLLLVSAFRTAWQPFFLKVSQEKEAKQIYARVMTYFILGASFVVLLGSLMADYVLVFPIAPGKTVLGKEYWGGIKIIPLILFCYLLYGIYVNLTVGIYIKKKSQFMIVFTGLAAVVNISSNFYLMPNYGMMGAAFAHLLAYIVMMITIYIANQRIYPINYEYKKILFIIGYLLLAIFLYYITNLPFYIRFILIMMLPLLFLFRILMQHDEKIFIKKLFKM